jgi:hypothetical protein
MEQNELKQSEKSGVNSSFYEVQSIKQDLSSSLKKIEEAGKSGSDPEYAIQRYVDGTAKLISTLEVMLESNIAPRKRSLEEKRANELRTFNIWRDKFANQYEIQSHEVAIDFLKISTTDYFVGALYCAEAGYSFYSMMEHLADWTTGNIIQALVVSGILLLITFGLKAIGGYLDSWFKHLIFGLFGISSVAFIYYLTFTRHSAFTSLINEKSVDTVLDLQSIASNNLGLNISLICVLMFGALTIAFVKRDPKQVIEAKNLIKNIKPLKLIEEEIDALVKEETFLKTELGKAIELNKNAHSVAIREFYDSVARVSRGLTHNKKDNTLVVLESKRGD